MKKLVDKSIDPAEAVAAAQAGGMTLAQAQRAFNGVFVIGKSKGAAGALDIDTLVEPLVLAEQQHILGILDGREEGYDLRTITIPQYALAGTRLADTLTVPSGEVWYINAIRTKIEFDATATITAFVRNSLWTDRAPTPDPAGQAYHANGIAAAGGDADATDLVEFGPIATTWAITNKPVLLRLPGGTVITLQIVTSVDAMAAEKKTTLELFGFIGKELKI